MMRSEEDQGFPRVVSTGRRCWMDWQRGWSVPFSSLLPFLWFKCWRRYTFLFLVFQTVSVFVIECWCRTLWCYPSISFSGSVSGIVIECWSRTFCNVIPPFRALGLSQLLNVGVGLSVMLFLHFALWVFLRLYPLRLLVYALYSTELQGILSRIANHFTCCLCM